MHLSVNIDHFATVRNARGGSEPDPVAAAILCEKAGAAGIVCHLREDRRHIIDSDVSRLREVVKRLDLEMAATEEIIGIALKTVPELVTLVPEKRMELTTEGGLDVVAQKEYLRGIIERFHAGKIEVSLFVDPEQAQVDASKEIGSDFIEIHTGEFAEAKTPQEHKHQLQRVKDAARYARSLGLRVNAGHGLNYENVGHIAAIPDIGELSIGHAIISRALFVGIEKAVREMLMLVQ